MKVSSRKHSAGKRGAAGFGVASVVFALAGPAAPSGAAAKGGGGGIVWQAPVEVASGRAHRGPWRMNDSNFAFVDDPTVAVGPRGDIAVAWTDHPKQDILFRRYSSEGEARLDGSVNISKSGAIFSWLPRLAFSPDDPDRVYALWQEIVFSGGTHGGEIFFARSDDGGASFRDPVNLSETQAGAGKGTLTEERWDNGSLDIAVGSGGAVYAAWTEYQGRLRFRRSADGGASFDPALHVAGSMQAPARAPDLAVGREGVVHLAWTEGKTPAANIHVATSRNGGRAFGEPAMVHRSSGYSDAPKIAADAKGRVHLAFAEYPDGRFGPGHVRYTKRLPGVPSFETPRDITGRHRERYASVAYPDLALNRNGRIHALWELYPELRGRPRGLGFTWSGDAGKTFRAPAIVAGTADPSLGFNGSQQGLLMRKLAVRGTTVAVVNSRFDQGDSSRVRLLIGTLPGNE